MAERPDRVSIPGILSEHASRLRALERSRPGFVPPKGDDFIELWDEGVPQGLVKALDFVGAGVVAQTTGDERGIINIGGGGAGPFDALVDCNAAASDPDARIFRGIGEAITYLYSTVGLTNRINLFVRIRNPSSATNASYFETANVTATGCSVSIFTGTEWGLLAGPAFSYDARWDHNGYTMSARQWVVHGLNVVGNAGVNGGPTTKTSLFTGAVLLEDCYIEPGQISTTGGRSLIATGTSVLNRCQMQNGWCYFDYAFDCELTIYTSGTYVPFGRVMLDCKLCPSTLGSSPVTWNLVNKSVLRISDPGSGCSGGTNVTFSLPSSGRVSLEKLGGDGFPINLSSTGTAILDLKGNSWGSAALSGVPTVSHQISGQFSSTVDIKGPALLNLDVNSAVTIRGQRVTGHITTKAGGASGQAISLVDADESNLDIAATPSSSSGTHKPYALDASSINNVLVFAGRSLFAAAGTDAGTNNRILPEGVAAFTTDGHVIEDEGVALTQRANMNFVGTGVTATDAGGKTVVTVSAGGHTIEDEGVPLAQEPTMDFVGAGVTATDAGGKTVVTIPGGTVAYDNPVESQFGDAMAQGVDADAARADHKHDRHDDAILFLTRMI